MNRRYTLRPSIGLALLLLALPVNGQRDQRQFTDTTSAVVVEVPVQVLRDGEPVRGLTAADFEVYHGRKKQQVIGFDVMDLTQPVAASGRTSAAAVAPAGRRHFLLLFDLAFSEPQSIIKAREAATDMVNDLHISDLVAVATYSSLKGSQLVLGFTGDRGQIAAAIDTLGAPEMLNRNPDPLRLVLVDAQAQQRWAAGTGGSSGSQGRGREAAMETFVDLMESYVRESNRAQAAEQLTAVQNLTRSFTDLAKVMGSVVGRKYVVYLSEGFDPALLEGTSDQARRDEIAAATQSGEVWNADSEELYGDSRALNVVEKMLEELRRADCVVQAVDIAGLRAEGELGIRAAGGKSTLLNFAKGTGGELYENFNDLSTAMGQMLTRTSVTYVLAFQPSELDWDGSYHRLRVEVKNQPRGVRVVHRPGFYAPVPFAQRTGMEKLVDASSQVVAGREGGALDVAVLAAPFAMPTEKAYVPVLVEVGGETLLANKSGATLPAEVYIYAFDAKGTVADFITQTMGLDLARVEGALRQGGLKFFGHLELPPGDYSLRVMVRNGATGDSALRNVSLHVPSFAAAQPALLPAFFPEPQPPRWLMVREQPRGEYQQAPYPFMQGQQPYVPASRPVLAAGKDVAVALVGYHLPAGDVKVEARVLGPDGTEVGSAPVQITAREAGSPTRLAATVRPPKLAPGDYHLEVRLAGNAAAVQVATTQFRIDG